MPAHVCCNGCSPNTKLLMHRWRASSKEHSKSQAPPASYSTGSEKVCPACELEFAQLIDIETHRHVLCDAHKNAGASLQGVTILMACTGSTKCSLKAAHAAEYQIPPVVQRPTGRVYSAHTARRMHVCKSEPHCKDESACTPLGKASTFCGQVLLTTQCSCSLSARAKATFTIRMAPA